MPFWKQVQKNFKKVEKEVRRARDALVGSDDDSDDGAGQTVSPPVADAIPICPPLPHQETSSTEDAVQIPDENAEINPIIVALKKLRGSNSSTSQMAAEILQNYLDKGINIQLVDQQQIANMDKADRTRTLSQRYSEQGNVSIDDILEGAITKMVQEYDKGVKEIEDYLFNEIPIEDEPLEFPEPDFKPLEPIDSDSDDEVVTTIIDPFIEDEDEEERPKSRRQGAPKIIMRESSRQVEDTTEEFYSTKSPRRGLALLFINKDLLECKCSRQFDKRVDNLDNLLSSKLMFQVERYDMRSKSYVINTLEKVKTREEADGDCLLVAILTRGYRNENGREFLYCGPDLVEPLQLWTTLDATVCPVLANKPKIFIQLGWSEKKMKKCLMEDSGLLSRVPKELIQTEPGLQRIPNMSHFFIISAIEEGWQWPSERKMVDSFIDNFISVMDLYGQSWDLAKAMTLVQLNSAKLSSKSPNFTSSLMRKIIFEPKKEYNI